MFNEECGVYLESVIREAWEIHGGAVVSRFVGTVETEEQMFQRRNNFGRSKVIDSGPRLTQLLFAGLISGLAIVALLFSISYLALKLRHTLNSEPLDLFWEGVCSTSFREGLLGLEGVLASVTVALAAFTWMERRRPGDSALVRVWLKQVVSDAKREEICFMSAMLLVMLFSASAWAYILSVMGCWWMRQYVGGDILICLVLFAVSGVLAALLSLMQTSNNGNYLGYARASRKLVLMAGYVFRQIGDRGSLSFTAEEVKSAVNKKLSKFSFLAALSVCIVWFPYVFYRGGRGSTLIIPCILALITFGVCFIFLNMMFSVFGYVVLSEGGMVRCVYSLSLCYFSVIPLSISGVSVLATYRTSVAVRGGGSGKDWWIDVVVFLISEWWVICSVLYLGVGLKIWGLYDIGILFLRDFQDGVVRNYKHFDDAMTTISSEARFDVLAEVIPADWLLFPCDTGSRVGGLFSEWCAWRRRVGLALPSEIDSNAVSVNLRTFIENTFKVDVGAVDRGNIADSRLPHVGKGAVDLWHYRSVLNN